MKVIYKDSEGKTDMIDARTMAINPAVFTVNVVGKDGNVYVMLMSSFICCTE